MFSFRGIDPDMGVTKSNITALMIAAKYGRNENVKALLGFGDEEDEEDEGMDSEEHQGKSKANINIKTKDGKNALHFAAEHGHEVPIITGQFLVFTQSQEEQKTIDIAAMLVS